MLPFFEISPNDLFYQATPGTHTQATRLSYAPANGYAARLRHLYLRINNATVAAGAANGIVVAQLNGIFIAELVMPAAGAFSNIVVDCDIVILFGNTFTVRTTQAGAGNATYSLSAHIWEY